MFKTGRLSLWMPVFLVLVVALVALSVACSTSSPAPASGASSAATKAPAASSGYPSKPVELGVAAAAGGGLDLVARGIEEALTKEKMFPGTLTVNYYDGGGGNVGMSRLSEAKGTGYSQMVNSNRVFLQNMTGRSPLGTKDFTPLARLSTDYLVLIVKKDSPFKTAEELLDTLKKDPKAFPIGHGSGPNNDQLIILRAAKAYGVDIAKLNLVAFAAGGDVMTNLLGGHVAAASTGCSETIAQIKSGDVRALAISAPTRLPDADRKDIPTWKEQGVDAVLYHWRGVFGPKDMPKDAYDYWTTTYTKMTKTATWQEVLKRNTFEDALLVGEDFRKDMEAEEKAAVEVLEPLGVLPQKK